MRPLPHRNEYPVDIELAVVNRRKLLCLDWEDYLDPLKLIRVREPIRLV